MSLMVDPGGKEIRALQKAVEWNGRGVLEIGCGDGRLTLRLAAFQTRHIEAIDPQAPQVRRARRNLPARYARKITYHIGHAERLKFRDEQFDIVIFSWAL